MSFPPPPRLLARLSGEGRGGGTRALAALRCYSPATNDATSPEPWTACDHAPLLTVEWFAGADVYDGATLVRRGLPPKNRRQPVSLRLDLELVEKLRAIGPGWQTRENTVSRKMIGRLFTVIYRSRCAPLSKSGSLR